ncbi:MAG: hypothetical protein PVG71_16155 [Anaerolineae bacterium]
MKKRSLGTAVALLATLLAAGTAWADLSSSYNLVWWSVDAGGTTVSTAEGYALGATAGQPDAAVLSGGGYTLAGGFWGGGAVAKGGTVYLPLVLRRG